MVFMILMIIFILFSLIIGGFEIYRAIKIIKNIAPKTIDYPLEIKKTIYGLIGVSISTALIFVFLSLFQNYQLNAFEWISLIIGAILFGFALPSSIISFMLHYYAKELEEKTKKFLFKSLLINLFALCFGLLLLTNGLADHIIYPLVNGVTFNGDQFFHNPAMPGSPTLAWYAICILSGAILVYFICDHRFYKEYGKHGILESTFFIAFPSGIIGARIGYVLGEWNHGPQSFAERVANGEWWAPLAIWEGGLTIISGALIGIIVGVLWFIYKNKKYSIWLAVDIIVPTILIAQAVGRWGNFFNCEVHGFEVSKDVWQYLLPKIVLNNAQYSEVHGWASSGNIWLPLFYIESIVNLLGYFFIRFLVGKLMRKYLELGDLAFLYISWYGLTRVIMEPLRDSSYNMGNDGYWSWMWSIIFVFGGFLLIALNHIIRFIIAKKQNKAIYLKDGYRNGLIALSVLLTVFVVLAAIGIYLLVSGTPSNVIGFNTFNNGVIVLVFAFIALALTSFPLPQIILGSKKRKLKEENNE